MFLHVAQTLVPTKEMIIWFSWFIQSRGSQSGLESLVFAHHNTTHKHKISIWQQCLDNSCCFCHTHAAFRGVSGFQESHYFLKCDGNEKVVLAFYSSRPPCPPSKSPSFHSTGPRCLC